MRWSKAGWMWLCLLSVGCATATPQAEPSCFSCDDQRVAVSYTHLTLPTNREV